jgi:hypothetical protein
VIVDENNTVSNIANHTFPEKGSNQENKSKSFPAVCFFWIIMMSALKKPAGKNQPILLLVLVSDHLDKDKSYIPIGNKAKQGKDEAGMKSMTMKSCSLVPILHEPTLVHV